MKQKTAMYMIFAVFFVSILAILFATGTFNTTGTQAVDEDGNIIPDKFCPGDTVPGLIVNGYDINNVGTAITENFAYRKVGSKTWTAGTLGTEITGLEPFGQYEIVPGIDVSDGIDNPYGEMFTQTIKCQADETIETGLYNDEVEASLTATFYNQDNDASAETFTLEDTQTVSVQFRAGKDEAFGNPFLTNPNVIVIGLNASEWSKVNGVYLDSEKTLELDAVDNPGRLREESLKDADFEYYSFEAPAIVDANKRIYIDITSDDSNAVTVDGIAYLFAGTYFIKDDGEIGIGIETEDDEDIGGSDPDSIALDFTA